MSKKGKKEETKGKELPGLKLTDFSKIVSQIVTFHGTERLDMRRYVDRNMSMTDPNWIPTKAGFSIPIDIWPEFISYLRKIAKKVDAELEK